MSDTIFLRGLRSRRRSVPSTGSARYRQTVVIDLEVPTMRAGRARRRRSQQWIQVHGQGLSLLLPARNSCSWKPSRTGRRCCCSRSSTSRGYGCAEPNPAAIAALATWVSPWNGTTRMTVLGVYLRRQQRRSRTQLRARPVNCAQLPGTRFACASAMPRRLRGSDFSNSPRTPGGRRRAGDARGTAADRGPVRREPGAPAWAPRSMDLECCCTDQVFSLPGLVVPRRTGEAVAFMLGRSPSSPRHAAIRASSGASRNCGARFDRRRPSLVPIDWTCPPHDSRLPARAGPPSIAAHLPVTYGACAAKYSATAAMLPASRVVQQRAPMQFRLDAGREPLRGEITGRAIALSGPPAQVQGERLGQHDEACLGRAYTG